MVLIPPAIIALWWGVVFTYSLRHCISKGVGSAHGRWTHMCTGHADTLAFFFLTSRLSSEFEANLEASEVLPLSPRDEAGSAQSYQDDWCFLTYSIMIDHLRICWGRSLHLEVGVFGSHWGQTISFHFPTAISICMKNRKTNNNSCSWNSMFSPIIVYMHIANWKP